MIYNSIQVSIIMYTLSATITLYNIIIVLYKYYNYLWSFYFLIIIGYNTMCQ